MSAIPHKKIAFFMPKTWPLANLKVAEALKQQFTDLEIDVFNIEAIVMKRVDILIINLIATLFHYGTDIFKGNKKLKESFWRTPFIFNFIKRWTKSNLKKNEYWFTFQIQSIFDCSIQGIPHFIYTDHTHLANKSYKYFKKEKLFPPSWIELEQQTYNNAALIFTRSTNIKKSLEDQYNQPLEKVFCVYAGSNVDSAINSFPENRFEKQNILFVGIDWERKGGPTLLSAFSSLQSRFPNATLTVVGCRPEIEHLNVQFIGKIPPEETKNYYRDASIFCMPTREEPFGIVFLEAMQAGLPIIGTNVGAIPDFIISGKNGFLVEPEDINGVADALSKLLNDANMCGHYGMNSKNIFDENYTWAKVSEKIEFHILKLLNNDIYPPSTDSTLTNG